MGVGSEGGGGGVGWSVWAASLFFVMVWGLRSSAFLSIWCFCSSAGMSVVASAAVG